MAMSMLYLHYVVVLGRCYGKALYTEWLYTRGVPVYLQDAVIPVGCLHTYRMHVLQDACILAGCLYTCRRLVYLQDVGKWTQMGPSSHRASGPNGSQAQLGQWAERVPDPTRPMGPMGPRPNRTNGLTGPGPTGSTGPMDPNGAWTNSWKPFRSGFLSQGDPT